jgi:hypothetical protein
MSHKTETAIGLPYSYSPVSLILPTYLLLSMSLPLEVLEDIAFWVATEDTSIAPLSNLIPLLLLNRETSRFLSSDSNHPLYARIYATKFDTKTTTRRLGKERLTAKGLAEELKKRCVHLSTIRTLSFELELIEPAIWTAFVMMLENDGKNERFLLEHAQITHWLRHYWIAISNALQGEGWPSNNLFHSICMWLLSNLYPKGEQQNLNEPSFTLGSFLIGQFEGNYERDTLRVLVNAMKLFSVGAHCYPIGHLSWMDFTPREGADDPPSYETILYGERVKLTPLPIAIPATISYLGIAETLENKNELPVIGNNPGDTEWNRVFGLIDSNLSKVHTIGSLEGVWEGTFTVSRIQTHVTRSVHEYCLTSLTGNEQYTDFMAYNALLQGSSSNVVVHTPFARHRQTFKTREYVVFEPTTLLVGDALNAFLPEKPAVKETLSGVEIEGVEYLAVADLSEEQKEGKPVQDVVLLGEVTIYRAPSLMPCLSLGLTGTFLLGTIPYPRSCEAVRRFGLFPQRLCGSPHTPARPVSLSDTLFLLDGRRSWNVVVPGISRWRRGWDNSGAVEGHFQSTNHSGV